MEALNRFAAEIRLEVLKMLRHRGYGHFGGSLSIVETLAVLYGKVLHVDPRNPRMEERDWFILSKGHAGPALYSALALKGFFDRSWLYTLNENGTSLPSHPDRKLTPGVDVTTGALGQGISVAAGVALSHKIDCKPNYTFCIVGDGELNEGQCWEAIMLAAHQKLSRFIVFVDDNKKQLDGPTSEICNPHDFVAKFASFGWNSERVDGGSVEAIYAAVQRAKADSDRPTAIILDTVKGQGVKFLEDLRDNHHIRLNEEIARELDKSIRELENTLMAGQGVRR